MRETAKARAVRLLAERRVPSSVPSEEAVGLEEVHPPEAVQKPRTVVIHNDGAGAPDDPDAWPCPECVAMSGPGHSMRCMTSVRERLRGGMVAGA